MTLHTLAHDFVTITEKAAHAAAQTMGYGDERHSDAVAVDAMREAFDGIDALCRVVIGEGERKHTALLSLGEEIGGGQDVEVDLAVDPLEGAQLCATGAPGALSVVAAAERGGLLRAPDVDMEKLIVGPTARGSIHLDAPVPENLRNIAAAFGREVSDLTVMILDRPRHEQLIADIRAAGARIRLLDDGDLSAAISAAVRGTGVHALMGTGGAPAGILAAAALRCLGGEIQARFKATDKEQKKRLDEVGITDDSRIFKTEDLASGNDIIFSATGVTHGDFLRGVRFFGGGSRTSTMVMSLAERNVRFIETIHQESDDCAISFY